MAGWLQEKSATDVSTSLCSRKTYAEDVAEHVMLVLPAMTQEDMLTQLSVRICMFQKYKNINKRRWCFAAQYCESLEMLATKNFFCYFFVFCKPLCRLSGLAHGKVLSLPYAGTWQRRLCRPCFAVCKRAFAGKPPDSGSELYLMTTRLAARYCWMLPWWWLLPQGQRMVGGCIWLVEALLW